ncbi:Ppx/GppA phosphatase family protein [Candidatus Nitronereus thalassa]|uniref:Ppx/GppA phosphatase family protein n=1 Tax=Candidatus Nitronereus thalassa TaxID=3020898 RepID=A0ABU3KA00_9BACT|nr:Ppx/GppA phosphatase family protein [Candidatus Nitronereus thalassa]MDT7043187.1 Ppx/GppA phosphatase family protein [Candidatus Nitronereus thalassa]
MAKLAVIDIGTNSIHMVLADIEPDGSYKIVDRFKDMTRLGDGTFRQKCLSDETMSKGLEVLCNLTTLARNKGYSKIIMTATSAVREAKNGGAFIKAVADATRVRVQVVTGQEEARLIYLGIRHSMELTDIPALMVDVGGGSVEIIAGTRDRLVGALSLKLGAIRLKDQFFTKAPPTKSKLRECARTLEHELRESLERLKLDELDRIIASSGMAANLAEIVYLHRTGRPIPQLNLSTISLKEIRMVEERLARNTVPKRLEIPGLDPRRVDTLLPAVMLLRILLELTGQKDITISDKAIREGLIYDFIQKNKEKIQIEQEVPNVRLRNVISLARRCQYSKAHSHHVAGLATSLFDQTRTLHQLGEQEREWLSYAAILHDVGYVINPRQHHKHGYYLITNSDLAGFTSDEIEIIANLTRYHRRAMPGTRHAGYQSLSLSDQKKVRVLSALLRIADGLDRSHFSIIRDLEVHVGKAITIRLNVSGDPELEVWTAQNRADLFEKIFKRKVKFVTNADT